MRHLFLEAKEVGAKVCNFSVGSGDFLGGADSSEAAEVVDIGELVRSRERGGRFYCSFELVPHASDGEVYESFFREVRGECAPLFFALTWHVKPGEGFLPLQLLPRFPKNTLLHLSGRGLKCDDVERILDYVLKLGVMNLLVLRGDGPRCDGDFEYALNLVEFIKNRYGDKFCIAVAGYPDGHPESPSRESDLHYLKKKVEAGASFIISQILFDSQSFVRFVKDCRQCGIGVPIIPGIFPIIKYTSLMKLQKVCSLRIPEKLHEDLCKLRHNEEEIKNYGINLARRIAAEILSTGVVHGFHLFTLNKVAIAQEICKNFPPE